MGTDAIRLTLASDDGELAAVALAPLAAIRLAGELLDAAGPQLANALTAVRQASR
jgi:hypothetical protein